ncbi:ABC transporter ATP-binding protein [Pseudoroseicyclus tamaricis]|uniref:ABC transporter ATP-binding protein n=1 Tax=Pseudoroseicyclus tamaricis TaxID=2705421 RepID=A0A6B2JH22_9RHOB|nr:ABC transporter ATP-binding protein [Pseudoroseicyclus tamaricis]NDV00541.1 ABC transporter ATP-binding protein [Pseudoroseicyclus tamaricis]
MSALLTIEDLTVAFPRDGGGEELAVRGVNLTMGREKVGIVGESGSGKSLTARCILGVQAVHARCTARAMRFDGVDLLTATPRQMRSLRGGRIGMVMQDPRHALDPVQRIGDQIVEAIRLGDRKISRRDAWAKARNMLESVEIREPDRVMRLYPHEVSGGMGQRVMIAIVFVREPDLLIADEVTSALDVTVSARILELLDEMVTRRNMGLIFISHDLNLVSRFCDRVLVMYAGRVVEEIAAADLHNAQHPYTQGLLACMPQIGGPQEPLPVLQRQESWREEGAGA